MSNLSTSNISARLKDKIPIYISDLLRFTSNRYETIEVATK